MLMGEIRIDGLASFRSLHDGKILRDSLRQPVFPIQLENIERENLMNH